MNKSQVVADTIIQVRNTTPGVILVGYEYLVNNIDMVYKVGLLAYVIIQIAYLIWKWRKEYNEKRDRDKLEDIKSQKVINSE